MIPVLYILLVGFKGILPTMKRTLEEQRKLMEQLAKLPVRQQRELLGRRRTGQPYAFRPTHAKKTNGYKKGYLWLYGLTKAGYDKLFKRQRGLCALCRKPKVLSVDHSHSSNKLRGLLCHSCNVGLGIFKDDPVLLRRAIAYLVKYAS